LEEVVGGNVEVGVGVVSVMDWEGLGGGGDVNAGEGGGGKRDCVGGRENREDGRGRGELGEEHLEWFDGVEEIVGP